MRGGVTVRAQDLKTRLPEDMFGEIREMHPLLTPKLTNATIRRAVRDYLNGGARKQRVVAKYGEISNWDTSSVTNIAKSKIFTNGGQESVDNQNMLKNKLPGIASYLWNSQERIRRLRSSAYFLRSFHRNSSNKSDFSTYLRAVSQIQVEAAHGEGRVALSLDDALEVLDGVLLAPVVDDFDVALIGHVNVLVRRPN